MKERFTIEGFLDAFGWIRVLGLTCCQYEAPAQASAEPAGPVEDKTAQCTLQQSKCIHAVCPAESPSPVSKS